STNVDAAVVSGLALDPGNPAIVYAGTGLDAVYKTTDGGTNWSASNNGIRSSTMRALAVDPSNTATIYARRFSGAGSCAFKSTNGAFNRTNVSTSGAMATVQTIIEDLVIDPLNTANVYAAAASGLVGTTQATTGIFKTTNGGTSWTANNTGLTTTDVRALALNNSTPATIYAATFG